ncbi:MAG: hypothetical protein IBJ10_08325 [Phycisphaerales bacterium]|nr:hypothetical protein [Phycisphaerales bacterium]
MATHLLFATLAQATPPVPAAPESPPIFVYYGVMAVLLIATFVISVMPSKRGHQD